MAVHSNPSLIISIVIVSYIFNKYIIYNIKSVEPNFLNLDIKTLQSVTYTHTHARPSNNQIAKRIKHSLSFADVVSYSRIDARVWGCESVWMLVGCG